MIVCTNVDTVMLSCGTVRGGQPTQGGAPSHLLPGWVVLSSALSKHRTRTVIFPAHIYTDNGGLYLGYNSVPHLT